MESLKYTLIVIVALVVIVVGSVGIWQLDWFIKEKNVDNQVELDRHNKGTQTAYQEQVEQHIRDFHVLDGPAKQNARNQACDKIGDLVDSYMTDEISEFEDSNC